MKISLNLPSIFYATVPRYSGTNTASITSNNNVVGIYPGHNDIAGNEEASQLTRGNI